MPLHTYMTFVVASVVIAAIPGPGVLFVVSRSLTHGARSITPIVLGIALGDAIAMSLSFWGLGAVLKASALWFSALKYAGAGYLIFLGIRTLRSTRLARCDNRKIPNGNTGNFVSALITAALNPKSIIFFVTFLPQFIDMDIPLGSQLIDMTASYLLIGSTNAFVYATIAIKMRGLARETQALLHARRIGGAILVVAGLVTATEHFSA